MQQYLDLYQKWACLDFCWVSPSAEIRSAKPKRAYTLSWTEWWELSINVILSYPSLTLAWTSLQWKLLH